MLQISPTLLHHFKGFCSSPSVILMFVYMKFRFSLSYRELEEMMLMRGASVDHSTLQRWGRRFSGFVAAVGNFSIWLLDVFVFPKITPLDRQSYEKHFGF